MPGWQATAKRYIRKRARRREKELRGWRGIVLNRGFAAIMLGVIVWLFQEPWAALWLLMVAIGGVVAALIIRAVHPE